MSFLDSNLRIQAYAPLHIPILLAVARVEGGTLDERCQARHASAGKASTSRAARLATTHRPRARVRE